MVKTLILSGMALSFPQIPQKFGVWIMVYRKFFPLLAMELLVWPLYCMW